MLLPTEGDPEACLEVRGQLAAGDTLSDPALSFYLATGLSRDRQLGLGSGVILRTGDREDRMPRERDDYGSISLLTGTP